MHITNSYASNRLLVILSFDGSIQPNPSQAVTPNIDGIDRLDDIAKELCLTQCCLCFLEGSMCIPI